MPRVNLNGKAYVERSVIAGGQETINYYAESNADDATAPVPDTYYPTPGLDSFSTSGVNKKVRCVFRTSIGTAYTVIGQDVFFVATNGALISIGTIADRQSQVYMSDNGLAAVLVDGSTTGYAIDLGTNAFGPIIDPSFYGADYVVFLLTFFVFNRPGTNQFYISLSNVTYALLTGGTSFDSLDIAAKSGSADPIVAILAIHEELWLVGALTTEVWQGTGAADFFFQQVQGAYIEHGCIAQYSAANTDVLGFWLMEDRQGKNIIVQGTGYDVSEISTPFLVDQFNQYSVVDDAIGFCFQISGHAFYCLVFPTENITWLYELQTKQWNKWLWLNVNDGSLNRHRANCAMFFNEKNIIGDWETGVLYALNAETFTDNGTPITRVKTFQHMLADNARISYKNFDVDIEVGTQDPAITSDPLIFLSWSDDRGRTFGVPVPETMGVGGKFKTTVTWNRLGMARDRIFKVQTSEPVKHAINGGFCEPIKART